jgi:hypothetical protein
MRGPRRRSAPLMPLLEWSSLQRRPVVGRSCKPKGARPVALVGRPRCLRGRGLSSHRLDKLLQPSRAFNIGRPLTVP